MATLSRLIQSISPEMSNGYELLYSISNCLFCYLGKSSTDQNPVLVTPISTNYLDSNLFFRSLYQSLYLSISIYLYNLYVYVHTCIHLFEPGHEEKDMFIISQSIVGPAPVLSLPQSLGRQKSQLSLS